MAHGVVSVMGENYAALEDIFKGMGILNTEVGDLRRAGVTEPFGEAIARCMSGGGGGGGVPVRGGGSGSFRTRMALTDVARLGRCSSLTNTHFS